MAFNTFLGLQTQSFPQFIQYEGPPKPKQSSKQPLRILSHAEQGFEERLTTTSDPVEFFDLTTLDDIGGNFETSGSGIECCNIGNDDGLKNVSTPVSQEDRGDKDPCPPELSKGYNQETAVVIDDNQSDLETDVGDPWKEGSSPHMDDCLGISSASTPHCNEGEVDIGIIDVINAKIVDGTKTQAASKLLHLEPTPPTSPSMENIKQSKQERPTTEQIEKNVRLPTVGSVCNGSSSESNTDSDDHEDKFTKLLTRKRKTTTLANSASCKRQSRGLDRHYTRRQEPTLSRKGHLSRHNSDNRLASGPEYTDCDAGMLYGDDSSGESSEESHNRGRYYPKGLKPTATRQASALCPPRSSTPSNPTPRHKICKQKRSEECILPRQAQWHLSDITFHSLPVDMSFLTASFRGYSSSDILSSVCAVKLLENVVGRALKLKDVTIKLLIPGTWFLTGLVDRNSDVAGFGIDQLVSAPSSVQLGRADTILARHHGGPSDYVDHGTSSDDYNINGDKSDEYLSDIVEKPLTSKKHTLWLKEDDERLRNWKEEGKSWSWIYRQFPNRSHGAVQVRWYTKLRGKA
ncbi:hypothetical protein GGP41_008634 [Bipolaris sorokiniana]|uniref:Myb-like domain-containing protein n=1 Tax=Cochliobolus sativus TaxID=45130 RepID=A0A8H5ZB35_COCSA|nr:hypothetical protein GGP41_008634 [Bipolaris sorokiniana]